MGRALGRVLLLAHLVTESILSGRGTIDELDNEHQSFQDKYLPSTKVGVGVLSDFLVGLLGGTRDTLLDLLGNEVTGLLERFHFE